MNPNHKKNAASENFVAIGMPSFWEFLRKFAYSFMTRNII